MNSEVFQSSWWAQMLFLVMFTLILSHGSLLALLSHMCSDQILKAKPLHSPGVLSLCAALSSLVLCSCNSSCLASPDFVPLLNSESARLHLGSSSLYWLKALLRQWVGAITGPTSLVTLLLRNHYPSLPDIQCLKNQCSVYISFFGCSGGRINLFPVYPSWAWAQVPKS